MRPCGHCNSEGVNLLRREEKRREEKRREEKRREEVFKLLNCISSVCHFKTTAKRDTSFLATRQAE